MLLYGFIIQSKHKGAMCVIIVFFLDIFSFGVNRIKANILTMLVSQMSRHEKRDVQCKMYLNIYIYAFLNATVFNHTDWQTNHNDSNVQTFEPSQVFNRLIWRPSVLPRAFVRNWKCRWRVSFISYMPYRSGFACIVNHDNIQLCIFSVRIRKQWMVLDLRGITSLHVWCMILDRHHDLRWDSAWHVCS